MRLWTLSARGLRFYWRTHLGVLAGCALGTAILVGALAIGDSVQYSLQETARARLGSVTMALAPSDRFFRAALADGMARDPAPSTAAVLALRGILANQDGSVRANQVQILGVDAPFWALGGARPLLGTDADDEVVLNERAAARLGARPGDSVLLRFEKPGRLPGEAPFAEAGAGSEGVWVTVRAIATDADFGRFGLQNSQVAPLNAFVPLAWLQGRVHLEGRANLLLFGGPLAKRATAEQMSERLRGSWLLADAELKVAPLTERQILELKSDRIFLDPQVGEGAAKVDPAATRILTYFVNEFRAGDRTTPYSMVAALSPSPEPDSPVPPDMKDDEIVLNAWLAEDLGAKPGDEVALQYFVLGPTGGLTEQSSRFRVRAVVPIEGAAADRTLMPDFPGLADVENCRAWKPGIPIDLKKIRKQDEEYWNEHRGTPKAFVTLAAGQKMWANRFGDLTAIRFPAATWDEARLEKALLSKLDPASFGLVFQPVAGANGAGSSPTVDFSQLFLGFSFFLIMAAMLLVGLLFRFGVEERTAELGTLLAVGIPRHRVCGVMLLEGGALAIFGALLGILLGTLYTRAMLWALSTVWSQAIGAAHIVYYARWTTLLGGGAAGVAVALATIGLSLRQLVKRPARELLASDAALESNLPAVAPRRRRLSLGIAVVAGGAAAALLAVMAALKDARAAGAFFGAGALLLVAGLALTDRVLSALGGAAGSKAMTLAGLGLRNATRRRGRSLAIVALLACGAFLIVAVGANRHDPAQDAQRRASGTGGFALYGESSLPVKQDLNSEKGRQSLGLPDGPLGGIQVVPLRVRAGDDASCLNLSRARRPGLLGVRPEALASRDAFTFVKTLEDAAKGSPWALLDQEQPDGAIPAIADDTTLTWSIGESVGKTLDYVDERGRPFRIRLVGSLANSILQGSLVICERNFIARFPSESGHRAFLVDAPPAESAEVSRVLARGLSNAGLSLTPAADRLASFAAVENTYLSIFQVLGGLGLALGSAGLGIVVLRNVLERRGELALLRAVGFQRGAVRKLVLSEHWGLLAMGLVCGTVSALVAVLPAIATPKSQVPYGPLALTLAAVGLSGALWTYLAARAALRGPLLAALRNE